MSFASDNSPEWMALPRYFAGELPESEAALLERWIEARADRAAKVAELRAVWSLAGRPGREWDSATALERIKAVGTAPATAEIVPLHAAGAGAALISDRPVLSYRYPWRRAVAAAAAIVLLVASAAWRGYARFYKEGGDAAPLTELVTRRGQRADLLLPDGSRVTLSVASRLRYPVRTGGRSRDLYLDGEAYFEVVHDSTKPFRVHTTHGVTEDLGTAFGVRAYGRNELQVVVAEGSVVLRQSRDSVVLGQADAGTIDAAGRLSRRSNVDVDSYLAWRQGRLVFHNTPVREVLDRLSRWYDLDLELGDSTVAARPFTASFDREPVERVLDVLALTDGLRYERRGSLWLVFSRRDSRASTP